MKVGAPSSASTTRAGRRIQEGVESLAGYADIFLRNTLASGVIPQISWRPRPLRRRRRLLARHHGLHPDGRGHELHVHHRARGHQGRHARGGHEGGPRRRDHPRHEERRLPPHRARRQDLASPRPGSSSRSCPSNNQEDPPFKASQDPALREVPQLDTMIPLDASKPYDVRTSFRAVVDDGYLFESIAEAYAQNIVVGFARYRRPGRRRRREPAAGCSRACSTSTRR